MVQHLCWRAIRPLHQRVVETDTWAAGHERRIGMITLPSRPEQIDPAVVQGENRITGRGDIADDTTNPHMRPVVDGIFEFPPDGVMVIAP
jgi:hypothetical protein